MSPEKGRFYHDLLGFVEGRVCTRVVVGCVTHIRGSVPVCPTLVAQPSDQCSGPGTSSAPHLLKSPEDRRGDRNQKSGVRSQESEVRSQKSEKQSEPTRYREVVLTSWDRDSFDWLGPTRIHHPTAAAALGTRVRMVVLTSWDRDSLDWLGPTRTHPPPRGGTDFMNRDEAFSGTH